MRGSSRPVIPDQGIGPPVPNAWAVDVDELPSDHFGRRLLHRARRGEGRRRTFRDLKVGLIPAGLRHRRPR